MGELMAVLDLLRQTADTPDDLHVLCDSQYVINVLTKWTATWKRKNWRKADGKPVLNVELVKALDEAIQGRAVTFEWVRGHAGHELNEAADSLARAAATAYQQGTEPDTGPGFAGASAPVVDDFRVGQTEPAPALFSLEPELDADLSVIEHVIGLERGLLSTEVRNDPSQVAALLHPDWCEVGVTGRIWNRDQMLASVGPLSGEAGCEVVEAQRLGPDQVLLLWRSTGVGPTALRTSLWVRHGANWQQRFHQATPEA